MQEIERIVFRAPKVLASIFCSAYFFTSIFSSGAMAADANSFSKSVGTKTVAPNDYYPSVVALSRGPFLPTTSTNNMTTSSAYRVVVLQGEAYFSFVVEKITVGEEGCCAKISMARMLDIHPKGPNDGIKILKWETPTSIKLEIFGKTFLLVDIGSETVQLRSKN